MRKEDFLELAEKYATGNCSDEERKIVEYFFDKQQRKQLHNDVADHGQKELILAHLRKRMQPDGVIDLKKKNYRRRYMAAAATFIVILGMSFFLKHLNNSSDYIEAVALQGEQKKVELSDGTLVYINSGSKIKYPSSFSSIRNVELDGEAFFEVSRDTTRPFIITSNGIKTKVLGTSFNIRAYAGADVAVHVKTGKVEVSEVKRPANKVYLYPNRQAVFHMPENTFVVTEQDAGNSIAWMHNTMLLENKTLKEVAVILERWYDVKISFETPDLEDLVITGKYKNNTLPEVLESISFLKKIDYSFITEKKILLKSNHKPM